MQIHIDYNGSEPICDQVVSQVKLMVVGGRLQAGEKLPSIRRLAADLKINPTTVSRIYSQLAQEGVVVLRQGQGVFVSDGVAKLAPEVIQEEVGAHARRLLVEGLRYQLPIERIREIVEEEYKKIERGAA
jgi:GntR family transcriptional regulator